MLTGVKQRAVHKLKRKSDSRRIVVSLPEIWTMGNRSFQMLATKAFVVRNGTAWSVALTAILIIINLVFKRKQQLEADSQAVTPVITSYNLRCFVSGTASSTTPLGCTACRRRDVTSGNLSGDCIYERERERGENKYECTCVCAHARAQSKLR